MQVSIPVGSKVGLLFAWPSHALLCLRRRVTIPQDSTHNGYSAIKKSDTCFRYRIFFNLRHIKVEGLADWH